MEELYRRPGGPGGAHAGPHPLIIILDDVRSMHNVGSVFRTADAFGIHAIYLCGYTPQPPHRDIHKTALGATETVPWKHFADGTEAVKSAKACGYRVVAVEQAHDSTSLQQFRWAGEKLALVFGNEVAGVSNSLLEHCSEVIEIPQFGSKHSLNISVSAGVVLWELIRNIHS
ncbi:MAG: TrmH family RNA methyltransferase [Sphingobacteriales bacterium]|nr:MAG: TrmH family RNA methyltransferase [Sphingobacteriales bacterium]